jgi:hypothetical protein
VKLSSPTQFRQNSRVVEVSARLNDSKIFSRLSGEIPIPVSVTWKMQRWTLILQNLRLHPECYFAVFGKLNRIPKKVQNDLTQSTGSPFMTNQVEKKSQSRPDLYVCDLANEAI